MGVKSCWRTSCDNIMCDRYSDDYGYICDECFDELKQSKPESGIDIVKFMTTPRKEFRKINNLEDIFPKS